jgi:hypothetical protein
MEPNSGGTPPGGGFLVAGDAAALVAVSLSTLYNCRNNCCFCLTARRGDAYDVCVPISAAIPPKKTANIIASTITIAAITSDARQ